MVLSKWECKLPLFPNKWAFSSQQPFLSHTLATLKTEESLQRGKEKPQKLWKHRELLVSEHFSQTLLHSARGNVCLIHGAGISVVHVTLPAKGRITFTLGTTNCYFLRFKQIPTGLQLFYNHPNVLKSVFAWYNRLFLSSTF